MRMHTPTRPGTRVHARMQERVHTQICTIYCFSTATIIRNASHCYVVHILAVLFILLWNSTSYLMTDCKYITLSSLGYITSTF